MEKVNYSDFVKAVATSTGFTMKDIKEVLGAVENTALSLINTDVEVKVMPSVSLYVSDRAARVGRNPKTGESVQIPAKKFVKAKFSASFKKAVQ